MASNVEPITNYIQPVSNDSSLSSDSEGSSSNAGTILFVVIILIIIVLIYYAYKTVQNLEGKLEKSGWTLYSRVGCPYCVKQMDLIPEFKNYVQYNKDGSKVIHSYTKSPPLSFKDLKGVPHWYNTKTRDTRTGFQDYQSLTEMADGKKGKLY